MDDLKPGRARDGLELALIVEQYDPEGGGAERSAAQIVDALLARGHRVTVLAGRCRDDIELPPGLNVERCRIGDARGALRQAVLAHWVRRPGVLDRFDASLSLTTLAPGTLVQPRAGLMVQSQHRSIARRRATAARFAKMTTLALSPRAQLVRQLERMTMRDRRVQHFVAISRYMAEALEQYYGVDPSRISLVHNAAEVPAADAAQRASWRERVRRAFAVPDDHVAFLFPAIDPWRKGLEPLMHAMRRLAERDVPATLLSAGCDGYAQLALAARLGVRDRVRLVGPTRQLHALFCAADVTVLPTFHDPASKVVIESLMLGTPAISTAFNGASDFLAGPDVSEPRGRVLEDPADDAALAAAMIELADPAERDRCRAATEGLAERLTMGRHVEQLERLLAAAAGRNADFKGADGAETPPQAEVAPPSGEPGAGARSLQRP